MASPRGQWNRPCNPVYVCQLRIQTRGRPIFALPLPRPTEDDRVFQALHARILTLDLPPDARLSEAGIAAELGVSRQPVHAAFQRLAKLGFLTVQPQKATRVSRIDLGLLRQARFLRVAVEVELIRRAAPTFGAGAAMARTIDRQEGALRRGAMTAFHAADDAFHAALAEAAGHPWAWEALANLRAHEDRVRYLALAEGADETLDRHRAIFERLLARDTAAAGAALRHHLGQVETTLARLAPRHGAGLTVGKGAAGATWASAGRRGALPGEGGSRQGPLHRPHLFLTISLAHSS